MPWNQEVGAAGEAATAASYEADGHRVVARNWRSRSGEIDLVVARDRTLVICEVKTRSSSRFGGGADAVGVDKQRRIRRIAGDFLRSHPWRGDVRFDVAVVTRHARSGNDVDDSYEVRIIEAAF